MIGPADIEAWNEDQTARPTPETTVSQPSAARLFVFPAVRAARAMALARDCAEMLDWQRRRIGRR